ncbi:MAG: helix-turn-helix domain-containing protein, partial [Streptococcus parasanguinis]|nr:helix-turn-helix domain-containing protein [Streptococcus parasanguinis]
MHIDRKIQLGELYKELRIARGLKQKDVARKGLSIAQLSKFENGQTMLSADKLLIAIESIHMTFEEFGHKLNNYELPKDIILGKKISSLFLKQDIKGLESLLTEVLQSEETDRYQRIQSFIIENAIHSLDQNYEINIEDRKVLVDYLFSIESWTWFELYVFGNTMTLISDEDLLFFGDQLAERTKDY